MICCDGCGKKKPTDSDERWLTFMPRGVDHEENYRVHMCPACMVYECKVVEHTVCDTVLSGFESRRTPHEKSLSTQTVDPSQRANVLREKKTPHH
jgi:hypothetical protein